MRRPVNRQPALKAQDLYLLLVLLAKHGEVLTYLSWRLIPVSRCRRCMAP